MTTLVRAAVLTNFFEVARALHLEQHALLRGVGLKRSLLEDPDQLIPAPAAVALLEAAVAASGCETFGLRMAESRQLSDFGVLSLLISHQPTLRAGLETIIDYRHLLNETLATHIEEAGKMVVIRQEVVSDHPSRQATELAVGVLFRMCGALLGHRWRPYGVSFTHGAPADLDVHRRVFACPVEFGSEFNGIVCAAADLDAPNPAADPVMARYARQFVETLSPANAPSIGLDVRKAIYLMLPMGRASSKYVAQGLGLSVRTMQRQLDESGENFKQLLNDVRRELAERYIGNPQYSMGRISELLGYGSPCSFTRWFQTQFGMAPVDWRTRHAGKVRASR